MSVSETESKLDEMECNSLRKAISEVETVLAVSTPGTRPLFESFLVNARGRLVTLDKKIKESQAMREAEAREQVAVAYLAQKEAALSAAEKQTYSGFLNKPFFTKNDFGNLEQFYSRTWDRLSESGKDEMSHRVWAGIRRNEYTFAELPKTVREKETEHAYKRLRDSAIGSVEAQRIPETDREDFIRAYEAGKREEAEKILGRDSFKKGMFRGPESKSIEHAEASQRRESESRALLQEAKSGRDATAKHDKSPQPSAMGQADFSAIDLSGMKTAGESSNVAPPSVPNGLAANTRQR